ncbi:MAG: LON peptidase substrate-binding domain-containing protein [Caldilineaceae bacterium]|nr:LON peptidase substrate-binding domain-containing protein [Caldilineaceae bacterium]MCY3990739.1 LON peptidase substrate-binding domain-containing protein [Caldilineaceae bacterium]MDE0080828.1 LON peptidase substrate-binding domain-containing protein [Caldilineaceae bacterium]
MEMPLFPLNVVLFPGMALPLHIFEPRYREMINRCLDENLAFGVVLIKEGREVGGEAEPRRVGTAARIVKVDRQADGRMNIQVVGTRRFRIEALNRDLPYLTGRVRHFPVTDGDTKLAVERAHRVRPKITRYVELLTKATGVQLKLDRLPEDATSLAFLTAITLQVRPEDKHRMLALPGVPQLLELGNYYLGRELQLLDHMISSQEVLPAMTIGPTGQLFAN